MNFGLLFRGAKFFHNGYRAYFLSKRGEIWQRWGLANRNLFTEFCELWSWDPVIQCCRSCIFTPSDFDGPLFSCHNDLVRRFQPSGPVFLLPVIWMVYHFHVVNFQSTSSFLYKCPASRGGVLWQHGLLVILSRSAFLETQGFGTHVHF